MATSKKTQMSELFKMAWTFVKNYGYSMAEALRKAWGISKLRKAMKSNIVKFYFTKVDGTTREAWGTLKAELLPVSESTEHENRKKSTTTVPYYDTEKQAFRCFKIANFLRMA